jgi:hypothetical protein
MKIYLDDVRALPFDWDVREWTVVRSGEDCLALLKTHIDDIEEISFDHDLGSGISGYDVLNWLEEYVMTVGRPAKLSQLTIHSRNPVGIEKMAIVVRRVQARINLGLNY